MQRIVVDPYGQAFDSRMNSHHRVKDHFHVFLRGNLHVRAHEEAEENSIVRFHVSVHTHTHTPVSDPVSNSELTPVSHPVV